MEDELLKEIREKVEAKVKQLDADIEEAKALLEKYESERAPLIKILAAMGVVNPLEEIAAEIKWPPSHVDDQGEEYPPEDDDPPTAEAPRTSVSPGNSHRWSRYSLPPRHRKFLDKFGHQEFVTHKEIKEWYLNEVNPLIQPHSLATNLHQLFRTLADKGIVTRKMGTDGSDNEVWRFLESPPSGA